MFKKILGRPAYTRIAYTRIYRYRATKSPLGFLKDRFIQPLLSCLMTSTIVIKPSSTEFSSHYPSRRSHWPEVLLVLFLGYVYPV